MRNLTTKPFVLLTLSVFIFTFADEAIAQQIRDHREARPQIRDHRGDGGPAAPPVRPAVTTISNFEAVDVSGNEMRVTVEYNYGGERARAMCM